MKLRSTLRVGTWMVLVALAVYVGFGSLVVGAVRNAAPPVTVPSLDIGFGSVDGRELAVVPYETDAPEGLLDLPRWLASSGYLVHVAGIDLDRREEAWRTTISSGHPSAQASVVAVGAELAYVASDTGLVVLDVRDGDIVVRGGEVDGLGDEYLASRTAYAYDADERAVVALTARGEVLAIPLDDTRARQATAAAVRRWRDVLNADDGRMPLAHSESEDVADSIDLPGEPARRVEIENVLGAVFRIVDVTTERVVASYQSHQTVRRALRTPRGRIVLLTANDEVGELVVATRRGLHGCPVGDTNWLGI